MKQHWLYKKESIRKLWIIGVVILLITILGELVIDPHAHFLLADWFSFNAVFGFISCVVMVAFSRLLGIFIKRKDDYYDQ